MSARYNAAEKNAGTAPLIPIVLDWHTPIPHDCSCSWQFHPIGRRKEVKFLNAACIPHGSLFPKARAWAVRYGNNRPLVPARSVGRPRTGKRPPRRIRPDEILAAMRSERVANS